MGKQMKDGFQYVPIRRSKMNDLVATFPRNHWVMAQGYAETEAMMSKGT